MPKWGNTEMQQLSSTQLRQLKWCCMLQVCVWDCQVLLGRTCKGGEAAGADSQCDAVHLCQGRCRPRMELQTWQLHGGLPLNMPSTKPPKHIVYAGTLVSRPWLKAADLMLPAMLHADWLSSVIMTCNSQQSARLLHDAYATGVCAYMPAIVMVWALQAPTLCQQQVQSSTGNTSPVRHTSSCCHIKSMPVPGNIAVDHASAGLRTICSLCNRSC